MDYGYPRFNRGSNVFGCITRSAVKHQWNSYSLFYQFHMFNIETWISSDTDHAMHIAYRRSQHVDTGRVHKCFCVFRLCQVFFRKGHSFGNS